MKKRIAPLLVMILLFYGCNASTPIQSNTTSVPSNTDAIESVLPADVYNELFLSDTQSVEDGQLTRFLDEVTTSFRALTDYPRTRMDMDISFAGPTEMEYGDNGAYYATYDFYCYNRTDMMERYCTKGTITIKLTNSKWILDGWEIVVTDYMSPYIFMDFGNFFLQPGQYIETDDILTAIFTSPERASVYSGDYYRENPPVVYEKGGVINIKIGEVEYTACKSDLPDYKWVIQDMTLSGSAMERWFYYELRDYYTLRAAMGKDQVTDVLGQPLIEGADYLIYQVCYACTFLLLPENIGIQTAWSSGYIHDLFQENYLQCNFDEAGLQSIKFSVSRDHRIIKERSLTSDVFVYVFSRDPFFIMQWKNENYHNEDRNAESIISPAGRMLISSRSNGEYNLLWDSDYALEQNYSCTGLKCGDYSGDGNADLLLKLNSDGEIPWFMYLDDIYHAKAQKRMNPTFHSFPDGSETKALADAIGSWL